MLYSSGANKDMTVFENVVEGLQTVYREKLLPLEEHYHFHDFHSPRLGDPDFDAKPMILLVGQYSTGKTTFIKYLLGQEFPGSRIGPEPTTDSFVVVTHGSKEGIIPGNALVVDSKKQFKALAKFGNAFLNRFQCSQLPNPVLKGISIVDTPGILSGEKQRVDRGYDFSAVLKWFAERADRILLLFDANTLDISDEFQRTIEALRGHDDKMRIVLNKVDRVDHQQLMRVYGALMWSLGMVLHTPEVARVFIGSFWEEPLLYDENRVLFEKEEQDLFKDMHDLPRNAALRKLNDLIKRARLAKVHAHIISALKREPTKDKGKVIKNLPELYTRLQREFHIPECDFPDVNKMQDRLQHCDFSRFNKMAPELLLAVDVMLADDVSRLMQLLPLQDNTCIKGGVFESVKDSSGPFGYRRGVGVNEGADEKEWVVKRKSVQWDGVFESLYPEAGKVSGEMARAVMYQSKLPRSTLSKIWTLADTDKDGLLDVDEFALAMHLMQIKKDGHDLPVELPSHLVPPNKRNSQRISYSYMHR